MTLVNYIRLGTFIVVFSEYKIYLQLLGDPTGLM